MEHKEIQKKISELFTEAFTHTSLTKRLEDINGECRELCNYTDLKNLREETGDLIASLIQLCNESGWDIAELLRENETKIRRRMLQYKGRGRKTNVAILGGAFNPPTKAHIELAQFVLNVSKWADEVWMCPCYQHMDGKQMVAPEHRLEMLKIATKNDGRIKIFDYEIKHQLHGETFWLLNKLIHDPDYENYRFGFILGQDRCDSINSWYNSEELLKMDIPFLVCPRNGVKRDESVNWYLQPPHIYIHDEGNLPISNVSSTMARNIIKEEKSPNEKLKGVLNERVIDYILQNNLYL
jgi:nicotinate-nucleotide adenylyltransferase